MTVLAFELSETQVVNASTLYLALSFSYAASTSLLMFSACSSTYATTLFPLTAYYGFSACCTMCIFANWAGCCIILMNILEGHFLFVTFCGIIIIKETVEVLSWRFPACLGLQKNRRSNS